MNETDHELCSSSGYNTRDQSFSLNKSCLNYYCDVCHCSFQTDYCLQTHLCCPHTPSNSSFCHGSHAWQSPIPQVDGPLSPFSLSSVSQADSPLFPPLPSPALSHSSARRSDLSTPLSRQTNYILNKHKQLGKLCKDTKLDDYELTISPVAHNVNIKCSAGFYTRS